MTGGTGGLGTSTQGVNTGTSSTQNTATEPYSPTTNSLSDIMTNIGSYGSGLYGGYLPPEDNKNYSNAQYWLDKQGNFGDYANQTAKQYLDTGGDPYGYAADEVKNLSGVASEDLDPNKTPGMKDYLASLKNDITTDINGQFAGAGRSLSGLNTQALSRGLSYGLATPLLNQYNTNYQNKLSANKEIGAVGDRRTANVSKGFDYAKLGPELAVLPGLMSEYVTQQKAKQPADYIASEENLINPIAGLGGTASGSATSKTTGTGTADASLLSQLGQGLGLFSSLGKFAGTL